MRRYRPLKSMKHARHLARFFCAKCLHFDALVEVESIVVAKLLSFSAPGKSAITAIVLGHAYS